jgi:hypothetical protein
MTERARTPLPIRVAAVLTVTAGLTVLGPAAPAMSTDGDPVRSGFSLTVSPTRLVVPAGAIHDEHSVQVLNQGSEPLHIRVDRRDFAQRPDGSLAFGPGAPYAASNWVRASPERFTLAPGTAKKVRIRIAVPPQPDVGEHQVALVFLALADDEAADIRLNRGIGTPVYISVPGPVDDSVRIDELRAPAFALGGSIALGATVHSLGTVHRDFRGSQQLAVRAGDRLVHFPDFTVVRGATREVTAVWSDPPLACVCHARLMVSDADGGARQVAVRIVIVPLHLIGALLALTLMALVIPRFVVRRYRARVRAAVEAARAADDA